jgi:hypothetical protein
MALIPSLTGFVTNPMSEDLDANGQILNDINLFKTAVLETNRLDVVSGSLATEIDMDESLRIASTKSLDFTGVGEIERGITGQLRLINLPTVGASATNLLGYNVATKEVESTATSAPTDWSNFPATTDPDVNDRILQDVRNITGTNISYVFDGPADVLQAKTNIQCGASQLSINQTTNEILIKGTSVVINGDIVGANAPTTGWFLGSDSAGQWIWKDPTLMTVGNAGFTSNIDVSVVSSIAYQSGNNTTAWFAPPTQNNCFLAFNQQVTPNRFEWRLPSITQYRTSKMFPFQVAENPFGNINIGGPGTATMKHFECAVTHPDGFVYLLPYDTDYISILNPESGASSVYTGYSNSASAKYACAITASDTKIYAPPFTGETNWLVYDPYNNTHATFSALYTDYVCVSQVGNFLYALATDGSTVSEITKLNLTTLVETSIASLSGSWWGCCIGVDGRIYYSPYNSTDILVLDPSNDTTSLIATGLTASSGMYKSCCLAKNSKIYFAPYNETNILILNTATGAVTLSSQSFSAGGNKYSGITASTNNNLYLCPFEADILYPFDVDTELLDIVNPITAFAGTSFTTYGPTKWSQLLLLQNATQLFLVPYGITIGGVTVPIGLTIKTGQPTIPPWMLSQNLNKQ